MQKVAGNARGCQNDAEQLVESPTKSRIEHVRANHALETRVYNLH